LEVACLQARHGIYLPGEPHLDFLSHGFMGLLAMIPILGAMNSISQAWNISTWQATTEFFVPWFYGFTSRDSISSTRHSIFLSHEFHISALKSHLQGAN
jgi:hypothetical protein